MAEGSGTGGPSRPAEAPLAGIDRALVVGLGRSGTAAVAALRAAGVAVVVVDDDPAAVAPHRSADGVTVAPDAAPDDLVAAVDLVVPSPGVPERAPLLRAAAARGRRIWSEPELGWRLHPRTVLAVTGTNGKTSVTELVAAMVDAGGRDAVACGNIGTPLTAAAAASGPAAVLVAELSSFQLRFCHRFAPRVGTLLNLAPDHLDWHGTFSAYGAAKARLWQAQRAGDWAVVNLDDDATVRLAAGVPAATAVFSGSRALGPGRVGVGCSDGALVARLADGSAERVVGVGELALDAPHHRANVAAAATTALLAGIPVAAVAAAARAYKPGAHRLEVVAETAGVRFVDDSKATNPHAAIAALAAFRPCVWIAGGLAKGVDLDVLAPHLGAVRHAVLIGAAAPELGDLCERAGVPWVGAGSIEDAVVLAAERAQVGDTVLLAPACASFDQFRDYAERGDRFTAAARSWQGRGSRG